MFKKLKNLNKYIIVLAIILILLIVAIVVIEKTVGLENILNPKQAEQLEKVTYKTYKVDGKIGYALITFYNEKGIKNISYDKIEINGNGKNKIAIDYTMEDRKSYKFDLEYIDGKKEKITIDYEIPRIKGIYSLNNGIYVNEPYVSTGFEKSRTRFLYPNTEGNLVPGNWINGEAPTNWYNYTSSKWANIYVENNGAEVYYVWIPRYCFKLDHTTERSDVKFINVYNEYIDGVTGEVTPWEELEKQGYQIPEAFSWDMYEIPGFWAMKYTAGDITSPSTVMYDMSVSKGKVTLRNMKPKADIQESIKSYTIALNGKIVQTITDKAELDAINSQVITIADGFNKGEKNTINVTALDKNGQIIGSMTKDYEPAEVNKPDTSGFNQETTFYVTYDDDGEHSTIPVSQPPPNDWYEYGESRWANIVTRNNDMEVYYVWIPRYEFQLDQINQRSTIKFLAGTSTQVDEGYQIPEAFTFNGQELTGFWAMKYTAGDAFGPKYNTEVVATSNSISTKGIIGTDVGENQVYKYYLNGEYKGEKTASADYFTYENLEPNTKYTVLVEIRNSTTNEYLGSAVKQITTIDANKPDLTGFNPDVTYYVEYDEAGTDIINESRNITNDGSNMPDNWYDYSKNRWANIVVKSGTSITYFTWIPRYEFKLTAAQQAQPAIGRSEVRFITKETTQPTDIGYQIPEGFTFNGQELSGFWAMKYTAGE